MGRKSKFTDEQWADIGRRQIEGESWADLAREHGVSEATLRSHFDRAGRKSATVREVAQKINDAQAALSLLPPQSQAAAVSLAAKLRNISLSIACAAEQSAATAYRFAALANQEAQKVDDTNPLDTPLKTAIVLTDAANKAAQLPINLLAANRAAIERMSESEESEAPEEMTPERVQEGVRRIAFSLQRSARTKQPESA